ncbi:MAG: SAM-dependent methyltransferase [Spirochaetota bacterium]|nr:MAG: SAM-dependent methyltransferase [Spirochaetota bacterium]
MKKVHDYYFKKAKQEKYHARSVFKLKEIDDRFRIIKRGLTVLDIGCAPGSWSQYLLEKIGSGMIVGIDIVRVNNIDDSRFTFIQDDIMKIDLEELKEKTGNIDLIVSDACPSTTGNKFMDASRSISIVKRVFEISASLLKKEGSVVAKILMGEDVGEYVKELQKMFNRVTLTKPKSSRKESREMFIIAISKRAES